MKPEIKDFVETQMAISANLLIRITAVEKSLLESGVISQEKHQQNVDQAKELLKESIVAEGKALDLSAFFEDAEPEVSES